MIKTLFVLILISILAGCASGPSFKKETASVPLKKGGGYYLDDGPGITRLKILMRFLMQRLKLNLFMHVQINLILRLIINIPL
jgi:hypothetical protein